MGSTRRRTAAAREKSSTDASARRRSHRSARTPTPRRLVATLTAVALAIGGGISAALLPAEPAAAGLYNVMPTDGDGTPNYDFTTADVLGVYATSDIKGGRVCIVPASVTDPASGSCESQPWGKGPNHIVTIGSYFGLLEGPSLEPGQWRLLTETASPSEPPGPGVDLSSVTPAYDYESVALSEVFSVTPCRECSTAPAEAQMAAWKAGAASMYEGTAYTCTLMTAQAKFDDATSLSTTEIPGSPLGMIGVGYSLGGGFGLVDWNPVQVSQDKAKEILKNLSCLTSKMYEDIVNDPPDPDFGTPVTPVIRPVSLADFPGATSHGLAASFAEVEGYGRASLDAFEKYLGADEADSDAGRIAQLRSTSDHTKELVRSMRGTAAWLDVWANYAEADPSLNTPPVATTEEGLGWQQAAQALAGGWPAGKVDEFLAAGFTAAEIEGVRQDLVRASTHAPTPTPLAENARALATQFRTNADAFDVFGREASAIAATIEATDESDDPLSAVIFADVTTGTAPLVVNFDGSGSTPQTQVTSYDWNFGDGSTSTEAAPRHVYAQPGTYTATLTVRADDGRQDSETTTVIVDAPPNRPPVAQDDSITVTPGGTVVIDVGANDGDTDGYIASIEVSGAPPIGEAVCTSPGYCTYTAMPGATGSLGFVYRITDDDGATDEAIVRITIVSPVQVTAVDDRYTVLSGSSTTLRPLDNDFAPGNDLMVLSYTQPPQGGGVSCAPRECTFTAPVVTTVTDLTFTYAVRDGIGVTDTAAVTVTVVPDTSPPIVWFHDPVLTGTEGAYFSPAYTTQVAEGRLIVERVWSVSDGRPDQYGATAGFAFTQHGTFDVTLTVTDSLGSTTSATMQVVVTNDPPSIQRVGDAWSRTIVGLERGFEVNVNDSGPTDVLTVSWDFGDGQTATGTTPSHAWTQAGTYDVTATVDDGTDEASITIPVTVLATGSAPELTISADRTAIAEGDEVAFGSTATDADGTVVRLTWDFGDGSTPQQGNTPTYFFRDQGTYTVTATALDDTGLESVRELEIVVVNLAPAIDLVVDKAWPRVGEPVRIQTQVWEPGDDQVAVEWTIDGEAVPDGTWDVTRTFDEPGEVEIVVRASDGEGGEVLQRNSISVIADHDGPIDSYDISPTLNCRVDYHGDQSSSFYAATACATFVRVLAPDGSDLGLYSARSIPAGQRGTPFTPVSQRRSGAGTAADPYVITTVVHAGALAEVTQTDSYVIGDNFTTTRTIVEPLDGEPKSFEISYAADCFLQDNDTGLGGWDAETQAVTCRAANPDGTPGARIEQFVPLVDGASWMYHGYGNVWGAVVQPGPLPSTEGPTFVIDNGMAIEWLATSEGGAVEVSRLTNFSALDLRPLTSEVEASTVDDGFDVTARVSSSNSVPVGLQSLQVTLPAGLAYVTGSTGGDDPEPTAQGQTLTWTVDDDVAPGAQRALTFSVRTTTAQGDGSIGFAATAERAPVLPSTVPVVWSGGEEPPPNTAPVVSSVSAPPALEGQTATVTATAADADADPLTYAWDLDDDGVFDDGADASATVAVPLVGAYPVAVRVSDGRGGRATASAVVSATNVVPVVTLPATLAVGRDGVVSVPGSFTDPGADAWTATVDWGDGPVALTLTGKAFSLAHTFATPGAHPVTVTVRDAAGGSAGTASMLVTVAENRPPTLAEFEDQTITEGDSVTLSGAVTDPDGDAVTLEWLAGVAPVAGFPLPDGCIDDVDGDDFVVWCVDDAEVVVRLTARDASGAESSTEALLTFRNAPPTVSPAAVAAAPLVVQRARDDTPALFAVAALALPPGPLQATATFTDPGDDQFTCGAEVASLQLEGVVDDGTCTIAVPELSAGAQTLRTWVRDDDGGLGESVTEFVVGSDDPGPTDPPPPPPIDPAAPAPPVAGGPAALPPTGGSAPLGALLLAVALLAAGALARSGTHR